MEIKTNQTSGLRGNPSGHHNTELKQEHVLLDKINNTRKTGGN